MTILNYEQLVQRVQERKALIELLIQKEDDPNELLQFVGREDVFSGLTSDWLNLEKSLSQGHRVSAPLPKKGHVFVEAAVAMNPLALRRLLLDLKVDPEREWELGSHSQPWSVWTWLASTVFPDGAVSQDVYEAAWGVLLPELMASGYDLSRPCKITSCQELSRGQWLQKQHPARFEKACLAAQYEALEHDTGSVSFNSASRRL